MILWDDLNSECLLLLQLSIAPSQLWHLFDVESAAEAWKKLRDKFQPSNCGSKIALMHSLFDLRLEEGTGVDKHLQIFQGIINSLRMLKVIFAENILASFLRATLPDSFSAFVTVLEARESDLDLATTLILDSVQRR